MSATEGLSALNRALTIAKALKGSSQNDAVGHSNTNDLIDALIDAKEALVGARGELADLQAEVKRLIEHQGQRDALVSGRDGYKYKVGANGEPQGYPACPHCEQVEHRVVLLVPDGHWRKGVCPACDKRFAPVHPRNSVGEQEERDQRERDSARLRDAARGLNAP